LTELSIPFQIYKIKNDIGQNHQKVKNIKEKDPGDVIRQEFAKDTGKVSGIDQKQEHRALAFRASRLD